MRRLIIVGATLWLMWLAPRAHATILLSDSFNYPSGALVTVSGGVWLHHSGSITGEVQVLSDRAFVSGTNSEDVSAFLQGQPYPGTTNLSLYASFTINFTGLPSSSGEYFAHFKDSGIGFRDKIFATTSGAQAGHFRLGVANASNTPNAVLEADLSLNTDYTVVMRYVINTATSTLWLNPSGEADPGVTATNTTSAISVVAIALRESTGIGNLYLDNLRIGTSFSDAVGNQPPEPPSIVSPPQSQTVFEGSNVTFSVGATGNPPPSYQWQFNGTNLAGATTSALVLPNVTLNQGGSYTVALTNSAGWTNSGPAMLVVNPLPPVIITQPQSQTVGEGADVSLTVVARSSTPVGYQWQFNGANFEGAIAAMLVLSSVSRTQAGTYVVVVTNAGGATNSQPAVLTVNPASPAGPAAFSVVTYNVKGNGATDWSTNAAQVQAIGRQLQYLQPDIVTFLEIPNDYTYEMTNFVKTYLPEYFLATNSATDGFIRSCIASRFAIARSKSWLAHADLNPFGYTNSNFTRDLFEAQVSVPDFQQPLHVFTTHLKSGSSSDDRAKRAAEASAISNYFVTAFLTTNASHPYLLTGDLNESDTNQLSIQRLISTPAGLQLTTPANPATGSELTYSIQAASLAKRFDYILPCALLLTNITASQVFRTDLLTNPPAPLLADDDSTASDHLPVVMLFSNPFNTPFRLLACTVAEETMTLVWESASNRQYRVEASTNLADWSVLANNLTATGANCSFRTNVTERAEFFRIYRMP